ncbi:hypothetical protein F0Q45_25845 [Mycobacterium simiae]|uniref:4Fe-4S Wbl-type domain-containing protein n=1 Tax=Mycobacterium simiae TaxID=1784 RepID=A0A5B1B5D8_MYCSI|nr:hypothetical protein F0Q45_25845 [Mycobacterium simiae]
MPRLPGAACVGRWDLFDPRPDNDPDRDHTEAAALQLCRTCPALAGCRRWVDSLSPKHRPAGVVAGRLWESW